MRLKGRERGWMTILAMFALAAAPVADDPHKLILVLNDSTFAVVDYPTRARCLAAQVAAEQESQRRFTRALRDTPPGDTLIKPGLRLIAFCIPG